MSDDTTTDARPVPAAPDGRPGRLRRLARALGATLGPLAGAIARNRLARAVALVALVLVLHLPGQSALPVTDRDEARFVQASRQMLETGDYVDIRFMDEPRWKKPAGIHWAQVAVATLADGVESGMATWRLPSLIGAALLALATAWGLAPLIGPAAGTLAGALTVASVIAAAEANIAKTDALLAGLSALALAAWLRRIAGAGMFGDRPDGGRAAWLRGAGPPGARPVAAGPPPAPPPSIAERAPRSQDSPPSIAQRAAAARASAEATRAADPRPAGDAALAGTLWLALGLAVLVKGPIAPGLLLLAAAAAALFMRARLPLAALAPGLWGALLFLAVALPWYVAIGVRTEGAFFAEAVGRDLLGKLAEGQESHGAPPGTYLALSPLILWPWAGLALLAAPWLWRARGRAEVRLLAAAALPGWLAFEATATKLPHYVLPLTPALAGLVALWLVQGETGAGRARRWLTAVLVAAPPVLLALAAVALPVAAWLGWLPGLPADPAAAPGLLGPALALGAAAFGLAGAAALAAPVPDRRGAVAALLLSAACLYPAVLGQALPKLTVGFPSERMAAAAGPWLRCPTEAPATITYREPSLTVLQGRSTEYLTEDEAAARLAAGDGARVWVEDRFRDRFDAALAEAGDPPLRTLAEATAWNPNKGVVTTLRLEARAGDPALDACAADAPAPADDAASGAGG